MAQNPSGAEPSEQTTAPPHPVLERYYSSHAERPGFVAALFDRTASQYDRLCGLMSLGTGHRYRRHALLRTGLASDMTVLDVATGTGLVARAAAGIVGPRRVVGLDVSHSMLCQAQRSGVDRLVRGRAEELPFADDCFDVLSLGYALRHVADLRAAFAEWRRVLRPGGRLVMLEITRPASAWSRGALRLHLQWALPLLLRAGRKDSAVGLLSRYYWDTIDACVPPSAVVGALRDSGLVLASHSIRGGCLSEYTALKPPGSPRRTS